MNGFKQGEAYAVSSPTPKSKQTSFFPILIEWQDTKEKEVVIHPEFIENGRYFKVLETNTKEKNK